MERHENEVPTSAEGRDGGSLIDAVADWLMDQALHGAEVEKLVKGCCDGLRAAGIPLTRALISYPTLHPLYESVWLIWRPGQKMGSLEMPHGQTGSEVFRRSPFHHMIETGVPFLRRRLVGEAALLDFPVLEDFAREGMTDYFADFVPFGDSARNAGFDGILGSWATSRPSGFTDRDICSILRIQKRLAVACKIKIKDEIARNILNAYLGPNAGRRVLEGQIQRGDGDTIHSVIWYSDLRGSTAMAETLPPKAYLSALNCYFECTAGAVGAQKGEVLTFIGDAVLAIFPIGRGGTTARTAAKRAYAAALDARARLAKANRRRAREGCPALDFVVALHVGDVMYGNIGIPDRLQFTVVGPAANEVARLEGLAKGLGRPMVVSEEFAALHPLDWRSLGRHALRGVGVEYEVFAPPEEAEPPASQTSKATLKSSNLPPAARGISSTYSKAKAKG